MLAARRRAVYIRREEILLAGLRRWALEVVEDQLEALNLRGIHRLPARFRWPPLPTEDRIKILRAEGDVTALIDLILGDLLVTDRFHRALARPNQSRRAPR